MFFYVCPVLLPERSTDTMDVISVLHLRRSLWRLSRVPCRFTRRKLDPYVLFVWVSVKQDKLITRFMVSYIVSIFNLFIWLRCRILSNFIFNYNSIIFIVLYFYSSIIVICLFIIKIDGAALSVSPRFRIIKFKSGLKYFPPGAEKPLGQRAKKIPVKIVGCSSPGLFFI